MSTRARRNVKEKQRKFRKKIVCNKNTNAMRKVRIIYNDPDATDSSSDESIDQVNMFGERIKRVVREVFIPMRSSDDGSSQLSIGAGETKSDKIGGNIENPGSSLLQDQCKVLDTLHDSREPVAGKSCDDGLFESLLNLDDSVINYEDEMWKQLEDRPPFWSKNLGFDLRLGKEEADWYNSL